MMYNRAAVTAGQLGMERRNWLTSAGTAASHRAAGAWACCAPPPKPARAPAPASVPLVLEGALAGGEGVLLAWAGASSSDCPRGGSVD